MLHVTRFFHIYHTWNRYHLSFSINKKTIYYKLLPSSESLSFINEYLFDLASAKIPCIGSDIFFSVSNNHRKKLLCIILHVIYSPLMHFNARSVHRQTLPGKVAAHWIFRGTSRVKLAIFFVLKHRLTKTELLKLPKSWVLSTSNTKNIYYILFVRKLF